MAIGSEVDNIINGGPLHEFKAEKKMQPTGCKAHTLR